MKTEKHGFYKVLYGSVAVIALFLVQVFAGKMGGRVADSFSYDLFDPDHLFAWLSVHHIVMMLIALAVMAVLWKSLQVDFGFKLGDRKKGMRYVWVFTAALAGSALVYHTLMFIGNRLPTYDFPLNTRNVLGTLGFQLLLSGTSEEILFRALPITVLVYAFGKSIHMKWDITLEIFLASLLFAIAHTEWSLFPFTVQADYFQLFYAFALGIIQGMAYQQSRSILYPILMHSISNVLMVGMGYLFAVLL